MKVRIFTLAKELGLNNKELIQTCNDAGIPVKNSALASITEEERDAVLVYIKGNKSGASEKKSEASKEVDPLEPVRKTAAPKKKVRALGGGAGPLSKMRSAARGETIEEPEAPEEDQSSVAVEEPAQEEPVEVETPTPTPEEEVAPPNDEVVVAETETVEEPVVEEKAETVSKISAEGPLKRSSSPNTAMSRVREMKPRASVGGTKKKKEPAKQKDRPKPSLPTMAEPPKLPTVNPKKKSTDERAQKPELRLTADILDSQSPLAAHLKKHSEQKKGDEAGTGTSGRKDGRRLLSLTDSRDERKQSRSRRPGRGRGEFNNRRPVPRRNRSRRTGPIEYKTEVEVEFPISVRGLSETMGRPASDIMKMMFEQGKMVNINSMLDEETALEISIELGVDLTIKRGRDMEEELKDRLSASHDDGDLVDRPPIVTVLGHVDHGKTTLVDTIRSSNVVDGEAGGITQHIATYQVEHEGKKITFVDTPGHAAFGEMRARGANLTDIIVLVVAADDGVMPQTAECISHAKAAGVPIIVAMNKIDLPDVNEQKVLQDLAAQEILPTEWGGETEVIRTSALKGKGIDDLLETILLTAEIGEYKASPNAPVDGICLEAFRDEGRGPLAWMIVREGTLRVGDIMVCGTAYGRVRAMYNDKDEELTEAPPSTPIMVAGLESVPGAGEHFFVMEDVESAREIAQKREHEGRTEVLAMLGGPKSLEEILGESGISELPIILKGDSPGSLEALRSEIEKFEHPEVAVKILHQGVGGVNESDVYLASASGAVIAAFHVVAEDRAEILAEKEGVEIRRYKIIYEVTDDIKKGLEGLLEPEKVEVATGRALVLQTFDISRFGRIAGCRILSGKIERNNRVHVIRDQKILNNYSLASLKREKDDAKEVREGFECGIRLDGFNDIKEGDLLEAYRIDEIKRTLDS